VLHRAAERVGDVILLGGYGTCRCPADRGLSEGVRSRRLGDERGQPGEFLHREGAPECRREFRHDRVPMLVFRGQDQVGLTRHPGLELLGPVLCRIYAELSEGRRGAGVDFVADQGLHSRAVHLDLRAWVRPGPEQKLRHGRTTHISGAHIQHGECHVVQYYGQQY
jgi:hypothetical protein